MLPTATEDAFGQQKRGRPVGHDNFSLSNNGGSNRNSERDYRGHSVGSIGMPTGKHNRRTAFARTGMDNQIFNINNTKIND